MYWWNLTKTLSNPNDPEWDLLIKLTLGDEVHSGRKKGFVLAREALKNCLKDSGRNVSPAQLKLKNYSTLQDFPDLTLSLSDSRDCGAAMIAKRQDFRSVGIDIEHEERQVKENILARVSHPDDQRTLRKIELWCLKEAVFKALMNSGCFEKPVEFSSIRIGDKSWFHAPSGLHGTWEIDLSDGIVIARAFLEN